MKIQLNLTHEQERIMLNNGYYNKVFTLKEDLRKTTSKRGNAKLLVFTGLEMSLQYVVINNHVILANDQNMKVQPWNSSVAVDIKFDESILNLDGDNCIKVALSA